MTHQDLTGAPTPHETPPADRRWYSKSAISIVLALAIGLAGGILSTAFAQGYGWHPSFMGGWHRGFMGGGWHHAGFMGGPLSEPQIDDRIDRMTKHMAIELDATPDQQAKIATVAKSAVHDLLPLREQAQAARGQALALLTAPSIDREAIERLRAQQMGLAETASKRVAQALADVSDTLNPDQRRKIADWVEAFRGPMGGWHRD